MTNKGLAAINDPSKVTVSAETMHGPADETRIDQWELHAARRALMNLRGLLYGEPMRALLKDQIAQSDRALRGYVEASKGAFNQTQVILTGSGLTTETYFALMKSSLSTEARTPEQAKDFALAEVFPMHPEHYGMPPYLGVIETMGGLPTRSHVQPTEEVPAFITELIDPAYPVRLVGLATIEDGTVFTYVLQQFRDTEAGLEANLRIWYPATCPPVYLEEHAQHYVVEFRNAFRMMAARAD